MKTSCIVATLVTCFLLCGFQQETSSSQRKPAPQTGSADKQKADSGKRVGRAAPPIKPATDSADKNATSAAGPRENDKVEVTALPPEIAVKQVKDSIDRTIMWCTIALTVVGGVGTIVGVWTLFAIRKQAKIMDEHRVSLEQLAKAAHENAAAANKNAEATEKNAVAAKASADAALLNAEAVINAERAWIDTTPMDRTPDLFYVGTITPIGAMRNAFGISIKNAGRTPARILRSCLIYTHIPSLEMLPGEPQYLDISIHNGLILLPRGEPIGHVAFLRPIAQLTQEQAAAVMQREAFVYAYGFVEYEEVVGRLQHYTRFGYVYNFPQGGEPQALKGFMPGGPQAYNSAT